MRLLITGGAGFIGSALVRRAVAAGHEVVNLDALTYAANPENVAAVAESASYRFAQVDLRDSVATAAALRAAAPDAVLHLAAESHVDRSIDGPDDFIATNLNGTFHLLQAALAHWRTLEARARERFRFIHVSTDEVYGALGPEDPPFTEASRYAPNSPYAASKAGADMLARAWGKTYGLPVVITNCSNNYGPFQFPEKLIPVVILSALEGRPIPVYGRGAQVRDWLFVEDHADGLLAALERGAPGETYAFGGGAEMPNIEIVRRLCAALDVLAPDSPHRPHEALISFVQDRPGHDFRYAIDPAKAADALGWRPATAFDAGLRATAAWYLKNRGWWERVRARRAGAGGAQIGQRLGLATPDAPS